MIRKNMLWELYPSATACEMNTKGVQYLKFKLLQYLLATVAFSVKFISNIIYKMLYHDIKYILMCVTSLSQLCTAATHMTGSESHVAARSLEEFRSLQYIPVHLFDGYSFYLQFSLIFHHEQRFSGLICVRMDAREFLVKVSWKSFDKGLLEICDWVLQLITQL